jgi:hypothetical protein
MVSFHASDITFGYDCGKSLLHDCNACSLCNCFDATLQYSRGARWDIYRLSAGFPCATIVYPAGRAADNLVEFTSLATASSNR